MRLIVALSLALALVASPSHADDGLILERPIEGPVVQGFEIGPSRYSAGHRGVDVSAPAGTLVRASASGRVHFAGMVAGRPSVSIDHGGVRTTYTPVSARVRQGETVRAGEVVGLLIAGHCAGSCLHWGLTNGEEYFDPLQYVTDREIRLLPMGSVPAPRVFLPAAQVPARAGQQPVPGRISSPFGMRVHPVTGIYKLHDGTDFAAPCGTPVRSPWAGVVTKTDVSRGYGYRVQVRHDDGLVTAYAHLPRFDVRVGQRLSAGSKVGVVGSTGYSTGCHLHWMAWRDAGVVDPMGLLG